MPDSLDAQRSHSLGRIITRISLRLQHDLSKRQSSKNNISPAHKSVLIHLEESGNRISVLAERLRISKQATSKLVQELESDGLIKRRKDPSDLRASVIIFTPQGRRIIEDTVKYFEEIENDIIENLGKKDFVSLKESMKELADFLDPSGF